MIRRTLELIADRRDDGSVALHAPFLGIYSGHPAPGAGLVPGCGAGILTVLGRKIELLVPEGIDGRVVHVSVRDRSGPVAYGELLMILSPLTPAQAAAERTSSPTPKAGSRPGASAMPRHGAAAGGEGTHPGPSLAPGQYALRAPTAGVFYCRPDPSSPPFVSPGEPLESGQTAGLIEVMKCFSPIVHPGGAIPSPAIVESVAAREGEEVRPGQILFVLRHG